MKFDYSEEQQLVADSVRRFVAQDYGFETRGKIVASPEGWSRDVWAKLAEIGLLGLPFPAEQGGFVGRAGRLVARTGSDAQRAETIPAVVEGRQVLAFAHTEDGARYDLAHVATRAQRSGSGH